MVGEPETGAESTFEGEWVPRTPSGETLTHGRRMTIRETRGWIKRSDVTLGRRPECSPAVEWLHDDTRRAALAARLRHAEGKDCNISGDMLLFKTSDGERWLIFEEP